MMANWKWNSSYDGDENLDWSIVRDGPIVKYFSSEILEKHINELDTMRYQIIDISTYNWTKENTLKKLGESFTFPEYYGENITSFKDCLDDMFDKKYNGLVIVLRHFNRFYSKEQDFSKDILNTIARVSWTWLLAGKKIITMIQSDDPDFEIHNIGGFEPSWNGWEWLNSSRES